MNHSKKWVLLKHVIDLTKPEIFHFDFLIEDDKDCLTWELDQLPTMNGKWINLVQKPNHRLIWLERMEHKLSGDRGIAKRIKKGFLFELTSHSKFYLKEYQLINGDIEGIVQITLNSCRFLSPE
tara:strand:+ start:22080 stop:22451 length:372 start_codon:yes stop_codon:yes gene_type:complete